MKKQPPTEMTPVLVLSAHAIALGVVRALGQEGVPVYLVSYNPTDMAYKSQYIKDVFFLPHPEKQSANFIQGMLKIGKKIGRALVFAADDPTLTTLAKHHAELKSAFILTAPDWSIMRAIINKDLTYAQAERAGIPYPKTLRLNASETLHVNALKGFQFPCLIKPVQSHTYYEIFKVKMNVVNCMDELEAVVTQCNQKGVEITIQEIIPGDFQQGYNFNSLFYNGRIQQGFTAFKIRMTDQGYGIPTVVRSCAMIDVLKESSEKLLTAIGYTGYSCIEYKFDQRDGLYKLMEVNGRYNRSSLLSVKAGINFPWIEYNHLINGKEITPKTYRSGIYYIDEFKDLQENGKNLLRGKQNPFTFLRPYVSRHIFAIFSLRDPAPFLKHALYGISRH